MTFNIWGNEYLSDRTNNLQKILKIINSDIILLQEVTKDNLQIVKNSLPLHNYIQNIEKEEEKEFWETESNIFWKDSLFTLINSGYQSFHHSNYPKRGLFWARLSLKNQPQYEFIVSTSHLPWVGSSLEITTGINQRIQCSRLILEYLHSIAHPNEPIVFAGDLNDDFHPLRILRGEDHKSNEQQQQQSIQLYDVFELLDLPPVITHPVRPSDSREEMRVSFIMSLFCFLI